MNWYAAFGNNPVSNVDPDGKNPLLLLAGAGALIGGVTNATVTYILNDNVSARQLGSAFVTGAIAGGIGALSAPFGGSVAVALGASATGSLAVGTSIATAAAGAAAAQSVGNTIDPAHPTSPLKAAAYGAIGQAGASVGPLAAKGVASLKQAQYFAPKTVQGLVATENALKIQAQNVVAGTVSTGSNVDEVAVVEALLGQSESGAAPRK